jgi:uncharacterized membrane protein (DUF373 family)
MAPPRRDGSRPVRELAEREGQSVHGRRALTAVAVSEDAMHLAVAAFLVAIGAIVLVHSILDFFRSDQPFATRVTAGVNGVLFVIIVMEILRTVLAHFDDAGLQLKPFLIIGIISAVRHLLTVGAQASLGAHVETGEFRRTQTELGVNAAVVVALVIGLVLIRRTDNAYDDAVVEQ